MGFIFKCHWGLIHTRYIIVLYKCTPKNRMYYNLDIQIGIGRNYFHVNKWELGTIGGWVGQCREFIILSHRPQCRPLHPLYPPLTPAPDWALPNAGIWQVFTNMIHYSMQELLFKSIISPMATSIMGWCELGTSMLCCLPWQLLLSALYLVISPDEVDNENGQKYWQLRGQITMIQRVVKSTLNQNHQGGGGGRSIATC